ncbi:MAG TPA: hypothetical protein DCR27_00105 [Lachnospiraceae bacterium]|nr:hypothetical protein [Lachnospiraceae bacterium]
MNQRFLDKHKVIHYLGKCLKHIGDKEFMTYVLAEEKNPGRISFQCWGDENQGKTIMIIRNAYPLNGFFAEFRCTLKLLAYAERYGFVPYIIYDDSYLYAEPKGIYGVHNPFEYYFSQPSGLSYESAMHSFNVVEAEIRHSHMIDKKYGIHIASYETGEDYMGELASVMKKYIQLNERTHAYMEKNLSKVIHNGERVLGFHHRGTDYKKGYKIHPKYITLEEKMLIISEAISEFDKLFVATDDAAAMETLKEKFGDKVYGYQDVFRSEGDVSVAFTGSDRENHKFYLGLEVLRDMYTLACCDGLVAGVSNVSMCARIAKKSMGQEYAYLRILDHGINKKGKYFKGIATH